MVLSYIVSRPPGWTACVTDIQNQVGLTRSQWIKVRDELRQIGCIPKNHPLRLASQGRKISWRLDIDFTQFYTPAAEKKLSTGEAEIFHRSFSIDGKAIDGFPIDGKTSTNQDQLNNTKKPPPAHALGSGGGVVAEINELRRGKPRSISRQDFPKVAENLCSVIEDKLEKLGLTRLTKQRISKILENCEEDQISIFYEILPEQLSKAVKPDGMALALARMATKGELIAPSPARPGVETSAAGLFNDCSDAMKKYGKGEICGPSGPPALASGRPGDHLFSPDGGVFPLTQSAAIWEKVRAGQLSFSSK